MTLEIGSRSPIFKLKLVMWTVVHLCCKNGVHISFSFQVIDKCHLTKMATMTLEIGSRSSIFELNLALHVVHLCCKDGDCISFFSQVIAQTPSRPTGRTEGRTPSISMSPANGAGAGQILCTWFSWDKLVQTDNS